MVLRVSKETAASKPARPAVVSTKSGLILTSLIAPSDFTKPGPASARICLSQAAGFAENRGACGASAERIVWPAGELPIPPRSSKKSAAGREAAIKTSRGRLRIVAMCHSGYMTVCLIGLLTATTAAETPQTSPVPWATDSRLREQLTRQPAFLGPIRLCLKHWRVSAQHVAVVLDRRVDPDQLISITLPPEPLGDLLEKIGSQLHLGYSQFGPVAYFGPRLSVQRLRTLAAMRIEEVRGLPTASVRKFLQMCASHWDDLAGAPPITRAIGRRGGRRGDRNRTDSPRFMVCCRFTSADLDRPPDAADYAIRLDVSVG